MDFNVVVWNRFIPQLIIVTLSMLPFNLYGQPLICGTFLAETRVASTATSDKPQSKVWYHRGTWWCALADGDTLSVYRLEGAEWSKHLVLAPSYAQRADCFPENDDVFILAHSARGSTLHRISFYDGHYSLSEGWETPIDLPISRSSETATLACDSTGRLWIGTEGIRNIEIYYSDSSGKVWTGPLAIRENVSDDDICAIARLRDGEIGVMWSDQNRREFGFAVHKDSDAPETWALESVQAEGPFADDHINLAVASDGTVYAAVKTEYDTTGMPQLGVLRRTPHGDWSELAPITILSSTDSGTRPIVLLNEERHEVYVFYTNWAVSPNTIVAKTATMDNLVFPQEYISVLVQNHDVNNVTSTRRTVTQETGVLVLAAPAGARGVHFCLIRDFNQLRTLSNIAEWER